MVGTALQSFSLEQGSAVSRLASYLLLILIQQSRKADSLCQFCKETDLRMGYVKNLPAMLETRVPFLGWEDPLKKGMTTHSSILAGKIP